MDDNIRKGLLSLLCAGDTLKCVYDNVSGGTKDKPRNVIEVAKILEVGQSKYHGPAVRIKGGIWLTYSMLHEYNGELYYSWICSSSEYVVPIIKRIVESPDTVWTERS